MLHHFTIWLTVYFDEKETTHQPLHPALLSGTQNRNSPDTCSQLNQLHTCLLFSARAAINKKKSWRQIKTTIFIWTVRHVNKFRIRWDGKTKQPISLHSRNCWQKIVLEASFWNQSVAIMSDDDRDIDIESDVSICEWEFIFFYSFFFGGKWDTQKRSEIMRNSIEIKCVAMGDLFGSADWQKRL